MSLTDFDSQINALIVELIPYLFENTKLSRKGLGIIDKNEKLNELIANNKVRKEDAVVDKQKMVNYLKGMIKWAHAQRSINNLNSNSNVETTFDDLLPKTI